MPNSINVIIPIAGRAQRFIDCGYNTPKPLISVDGVPMIKLAIDSLINNKDRDQYNLIFVVRYDHCVNHHIDDALRNIFHDWHVDIVIIDYITQGTLCTCLCASDKINLDLPTIIYTPDVCFENSFSILDDFCNHDLDGLLLTFKANSPDHSYVQLDENSLVVRAVEKEVISNDAIVGVYCFKSGNMLVEYANILIDLKLTTNNEYYVAPVFNLMAQSQLKIGIHRINKMYVLGTPDDLKFYESYVIRCAKITAIAICCDHSGYDLKQLILNHFTLSHPLIKVLDFGTYSNNDSDHYESLRPCAEYVLKHSNTLGIGICSTGQGFNIAANKVNGIRSALVCDCYTATMCRRHNAVNFVCLPSRYVEAHNISDIFNNILNNQFDGGRHSTRIQKMLNDKFFIG